MLFFLETKLLIGVEHAPYLVPDDTALIAELVEVHVHALPFAVCTGEGGESVGVDGCFAVERVEGLGCDVFGECAVV